MKFLTFLILSLLSIARLDAAIAAAAVWEVRTTGADTNGGGFVTGASGTDYSQQDAAQYALTGVTTAGADAILLSASAASNMVGNICQIISGTNFTAGFYEIISVSAGVSITLDRTCTTAAGSSGVVNIGGALLTPDKADDGMVAGNICYFKYGTYARTTSWALTLLGTVAAPIQFISYDTNRTLTNTDANRSLITTGTTATPLVAGNNSDYVMWRNVMWSNTASGGNKAVCFTNSTSLSDENVVYNCSFDGFTNVVNNSSTTANNYVIASMAYSEIKNGTSGGFTYAFSSAVINLYNCYIHDNTGPGVELTNSGGTVTAIGCVFDTNSTYGILCSRTTSAAPAYFLSGNTFYNNASGGIHYSTTSAPINPRGYCVNNIFYGGTYGFSVATAAMIPMPVLFTKNAFGNQGTAATLNIPSAFIMSSVTLSADPFTNGSAGDFSLNNTAGGGALLRGTGYPAAFPAGLTDNYLDLGAAQHQDSGGGAIETSSGYAY